METRLIECKLIDVPRVSGDVRTFSKEFAVKLADSLKIEGQLNPIVIRPNPAAPGRYLLVCGRHRFYAMKKVLKERFIRATVIEDMDEAEAGIAADVENLWRNHLNQAQHAAAIKRWHTHWLAKMPTIEPDAVNTEADDASEAKFDETVAAVTGKAPVTIRRSKAIGNAFTEKQLEVFAHLSVNQTDMMTIAKIKDENQRAEVVSLIASGMVAEDAIKEVMKDKAPARYNNKTAGAEAAEARAATREEKAPELSDDEWFDKYCGEKAAMLGDPARFKSDALLFRLVADIRHIFRSKGKKFLADAKKAGNHGAFWNLVNRFVSISHPRDWPICPKCNGIGKDARAAKCGNCQGGGYLVTGERRV